ncbi:hypothetical protein JX265_012855 [Neoarthrinium moseri]|uniref:GST C-terminal domain-containing protein n=1 Tax=Neoarthrinium moseri TaxID=1658444 RepID=A0A9Q0AGD6_9PEZI|nr:hypothetical protein JX266_013348 [Neoarthrinium moseri]KAI1852966.1 hypothetical protein JX265_012855 [Neoarthrinium moseri]
MASEIKSQGVEVPAEIPAWQKTVPTIHHLEHSQSLRVVWALQELHNAKGLKFHIKNYPRVQPKNLDLAKVSPMGKAPILTVETLDGKPLPDLQIRDGVIMESKLILNWISQSYGGELWEQEDDTDKRRNMYFQEFASASLSERVLFAMIFEIIAQVMPFPLRQILGLLLNPLAKVFKGHLPDYFDFMEGELSDERPWFAGTKMGVADFCMEYIMTIAIDRRYLDEETYPKIKKWHDTIRARPAYQEAIKKGGGPKHYDMIKFGK